jgi:spermidine/putrescine-binding protein
MGFKKMYSVFLLFVLLVACSLETAKPAKNGIINVASDCFSSSDSSLFKTFTKKTGVAICIHKLSSSEIRSRLKNEQTDTELDAVILKSSYDALVLNQEDLFQLIPKDSFPEIINSKYFSESRSVVGLGFDPYIIVRRKEALPIANYAMLSNSDGYSTDLTEAPDLMPFYLFVLKKLKREKAQEWIKAFRSKRIKRLTREDTLIYSHLLFTKHSSYASNKKTSLVSYKNGERVYPNQRAGGAYYDMPCFAVVKQARNYSNALMLMSYLLSQKGNNLINKNLETISFYSHSTKHFRRNRISPLRKANLIHVLNT